MFFKFEGLKEVDISFNCLISSLSKIKLNFLILASERIKGKNSKYMLIF